MIDVKCLYCLLILWNITVFIIYGIDKRKSVKGNWRIKESTLITLTFFMGGIGAILGMSVFRHKTKHLKFKISVPLALIVNILIIVGGYYLANRNI